LPAGLDPDVFTVTERSNGTFQLKADTWPLYRFAGDAAPGGQVRGYAGVRVPSALRMRLALTGEPAPMG
jgi:hypothetical protein